MDNSRPNGSSSPLPVRTLAQADRPSPHRLRQHALLGFRYVKAIAAFILFLGTDALLVTTAPHLGSLSRGYVQWVWGMHNTALAVVLLLGCMAAVLWWGADGRSREDRRFQESESGFLACVVLALLGLHLLVSIVAASTKGSSLQTVPLLATRGLISELALPRSRYPPGAVPQGGPGTPSQGAHSCRQCQAVVPQSLHSIWVGEGGQGAECMLEGSSCGDSLLCSLKGEGANPPHTQGSTSPGDPPDHAPSVEDGAAQEQGGDGPADAGIAGDAPRVAGGGSDPFLVLTMSWYVVVLVSMHTMWLLKPHHSGLLCALVLACFASHSLVEVEPAAVVATACAARDHGDAGWCLLAALPRQVGDNRGAAAAVGGGAESHSPISPDVVFSPSLGMDPLGVSAGQMSAPPLVPAWPRWSHAQRLLWVHLFMALVACAGASSFLSCERRRAVLAASRGSHTPAPSSAPSSVRHGVRVPRYQPRGAGGLDASAEEGVPHGPLEAHGHAAPSWFYRRLSPVAEDAHVDAHAAHAHSGTHVTFDGNGGVWEHYSAGHVGALQGSSSFLHSEESLRRVSGMIENFLKDGTVPTGQNLHVMRMLVDTALSAGLGTRPASPGGSHPGATDGREAISHLLGDELQFPVRYAISPAPAPVSLLPEPTDMLVETTPELEELLKEHLGEWDMDVRKVEQLSGGRPLAILAHRALTKDGRTAKLKIDEVKLIRFLNAIESGMPANPYHCATHIADVVASCVFLLDGGGLGHHLNDAEHVAMLLAAAIHDFRHPGVGNDYLVKSEHPIARRYSDRSVLENFHLASAFELMRLPGMNFMEGVSRTDRAEIRRLVVDMVLATDIRRHFELVDVVKQQLENGSVFASSKNSDHSLLMQMALKCADIGHVSKSRERHLAWVDAIQEEFFQQGDLEAAEGLEVAPFMDRKSPNLARSQVGFFNFIVLPLFKVYSATFPASSRLLDMAVDNYGYWQKKATGKLAS